jgi:ribonuclease Z
MKKSSFVHEFKIVNGLDGDPAIYVFFPTLGKTLLFDLGMLDRLSNKELLKVTHAFVTHTHIDHFIGFDRLLRVNIPHGRKIYLYGPQGFIHNVSAKLKAYTWNLLEPGQINFVVKEILPDGTTLTASINNDNAFNPQIIEKSDTASTVTLLDEYADRTYVTATNLDHRTPSIAYRLHIPRRFHVKSEVIAEQGWTPGPWIRALQIAMTTDHKDDLISPDQHTSRTAAELSDLILEELPPFSIGYVTDFIFSPANLKRCRELLEECHTLFCESTFADSDIHRAVAKKHLTSRQAALIAAMVGAKLLEVHHISGIYAHNVEQVKIEALDFFECYRNKTASELKAEIERELARIESLPLN